MKFYLVKDFVELVNLGAFRENEYNEFDLKFPSLVKPGDQSESSREFSGILKELLGNIEWSSIFYLFTCLNGDMQIMYPNDVEEEMLELFTSIFTPGNIKFSLVLSLCYIPTEDTPISLENSIILRKSFELDSNITHEYCGYSSNEEEETAANVNLWSHENGFIHVKLTILATLNQKAVNVVMEGKEENYNSIVDLNRKMLVEEICTNLEIICGDGKIVKCHREVLSGRIKVFQDRFQTQEMKEARTGTLVMENMSEKVVKAFLGWIYWNDEKAALLSSDVAVELLIAGDKYDLEELVEGMQEVILERRGYDEQWFSVDSAVNLFRWASLKEMGKLREKARGVLKFFRKTFPEKLVESEEYQDLIKKDAKVAMELD